MRVRLLLTSVQKLSQPTIYILFVPIRLNLNARIRGGGLRLKEREILAKENVKDWNDGGVYTPKRDLERCKSNTIIGNLILEYVLIMSFNKY